jgi:ABC-type transporter Mla MlaB component
MLPRLCDRLRGLLLASEADLVGCGVGNIGEVDAATIDALARLQLTVRRMGREMLVLDASGELRDLLALTGLSDVVPCAELPLEPRRQAEQREPPLRIEEERDAADPIP